MTLPSWPGQHSTPLSSASEHRYAAAGISLLISAAVLTSWAVVGWAHVAQFNGATERLFSTVAFADDDLAIAAPEVSYKGALVVASALAIVAVAVGWAVLDRWRRARTAAIILAFVVTACSVKLFLLNFVAGIEVPDTGISNHLYRQSVRQFNELTPWRSALWFRAFTMATGVVSIVLAITACYLLRKFTPVHHPHPLKESS